ncbi:MAG TPA: TauD/TfdA family dioxygenase, partial [Pseudonocardiaceae bacterium]
VRDALGLAAAAPAEDFAPREDLGHGVTTAPEWDAGREMCLHHERSYGADLPAVLLLACPRPAATGGVTLLADTRAVLAALPPELVRRFERHGWELTRNFRPFFGLPWATAHGTADPGELTTRLAARDVTADWRADGTLHTTQRRAAVVRHPATGERCWFNELAFFSGWSVDAAEREVLLATFGPDGLPFTTAAGDGTPLDRDEFQAVLDAYDAVAREHEWRPGDVLVLDNVLTAHGRTPFTGERTLLVAPAAPIPHPGPA